MQEKHNFKKKKKKGETVLQLTRCMDTLLQLPH